MIRCRLCRRPGKQRWVHYDDGHAGGYPHYCSNLEPTEPPLPEGYRCIDHDACGERVLAIVGAHVGFAGVCDG